MDGLDPRLELIRRVLQRLPFTPAERYENAREAAVALIIRPRDDLELLLIKRAEHEKDPWSGHIALPGGRRAPVDEDLLATAMRESEEEVEVALNRIGTSIGRLDEVSPRTPRLPPLIIAPFVLAVPPDTTSKPDAREVVATMWIPLQSLREPGAVSEFVMELEGGRRSFPSFRYGEHVIWGLTHRILTQFLTIASEAGV